MAQKDYYKVLGISKSASEKDIKKAYRKLAVEYHPDKTQGDKSREERFKEISEAYQVLGNAEKRRQYDALGHDWEQFQQSGSSYEEFMEMKKRAQQQQQYSRRQQASGFGGGEDFSDIFGSFFGGRQAGFGGRTQDFPGADVSGEVQIDLQEAYRGTERLLMVEGKKINLSIKPGAYTGLQLRARGKGQKGTVGRAGDLYVKVKVKPHPVFERRGDDLYMNASIGMFDALLGGQLEVVTLSGKVNVSIKEGTQNGKMVRLKGKGMPVYGKPGQFGDLFVTLQVQLPTKLSPSQKQKLQELKESLAQKNKV
jgi:curved DNA-binding protein